MVDLIQNTLAAGELSPNLYGRSDLAKYHAGAMLMHNVFVDYRGGASSRPGTQFLGFTASGGYGRLKKFVFSASQTYMLVFTDLRLEFIRNPLTPSHLNGSNSRFTELSPGVRYGIVTPYPENILLDLKFSQAGDILTITHPQFPIYNLVRHGETNWTLDAVSMLANVSPPANLSATITDLPANSTDPQITNYSYVVTSVGTDGQESQQQYFPVSPTGINIATTQGSVTLAWNAAANAVYYNVYKAVPATGKVGGSGILVTPGSVHGFIGTAYGTSFVDTNIIPDFTQTPPLHHNPFQGGTITSYSIINSGSGYSNVGTTIGIAGNPAGYYGEVLIPVISTNVAGGTGGITGIVLSGEGTVPIPDGSVLAAFGSGTGFAGTVTTTAFATAYPSESAYFQQRHVFAASLAQPITLWGSKTGYFNNFDVSNPPLDSDAFEFTIASQEINRIRHLISMPGGLVIFSDGGVVQLSGGSGSVSNPTAVTPGTAVIVPQSSYGSTDVEPIVINYDILYVQTQGSIVRDLAYNFYVNTYTGTDLTILSNHFFHPHYIVDWAYQDVPNKVIWCVRDDGRLLSLTFLKEQDLYGWAWHDGVGGTACIESVREGTEDAVYLIVNRPNGYSVERLAGRIFNSVIDAWCLDSALAFDGPPTTTFSGLSHLEGQTVYACADGVGQGPFTVSGGTVNLTTPASTVVIGLPFTAEIQQIPPEGQTPVSAKLNRTVATTIRCMNTGPGLQIGNSFDTLHPWKPGLSSTDAPWKTPYQPTGLVTGEQRIIVEPVWTAQGGVCVRMTDPLPFTVLNFINEVATAP